MLEQRASNFIEELIDEDLKSGVYDYVQTRFPPEPNGYLHVGHAKAICIDFGMAEKYDGVCNLRFDDTNPLKEDTEYVEAIMEDIRWLGFEWNAVYYASDYFEQMYGFACQLIEKGKAYVCDLSAEQIREYRGTLTAPGQESPYRTRSAEESLDLFQRMRAGEFPDGSRVLRAKIDMASPNLNMRDPVLYRIARVHHHRTGDDWLIYPMYDFAHPLSDAVEGVTHSICTLEFEDHRPLYDWCLEHVGFERPPRQIEFARLNLTRTIMSKRYLKRLVDGGVVSGWDDPRMPTIGGLRRRGYTPYAIRDFCGRIGVAKANSMVDVRLLEHCVREDLNQNAARAMAVIRPLKVVLENWPADTFEDIEVENNPNCPEDGTHTLRFGRELFIEQEDFMEQPPKKFFRLRPGGEVRLRGAYIIKCERVEKDEAGNVTGLICSYDPETRSGSGAGRKVKGTLHWVEAQSSVVATVRQYDYLLDDDDESGREFMERLNPESVEVLEDCRIEPFAAGVSVGERLQFMRQGYFIKDADSASLQRPVFNRIVGLKDSWAKMGGQGK
ncbi:MAG: glutamine--tRNA ligase/YqeY domain fusion protein [Christensenellales bacterium]